MTSRGAQSLRGLSCRCAGCGATTDLVYQPNDCIRQLVINFSEHVQLLLDVIRQRVLTYLRGAVAAELGREQELGRKGYRRSVDPQYRVRGCEVARVTRGETLVEGG